MCCTLTLNFNSFSLCNAKPRARSWQSRPSQQPSKVLVHYSPLHLHASHSPVVLSSGSPGGSGDEMNSRDILSTLSSATSGGSGDEMNCCVGWQFWDPLMRERFPTKACNMTSSRSYLQPGLGATQPVVTTPLARWLLDIEYISTESRGDAQNQTWPT